jgi:hypothetical protein
MCSKMYEYFLVGKFFKNPISKTGSEKPTSKPDHFDRCFPHTTGDGGRPATLVLKHIRYCFLDGANPFNLLCLALYSKKCGALIPPSPPPGPQRSGEAAKEVKKPKIQTQHFSFLVGRTVPRKKGHFIHQYHYSVMHPLR